MFRTVEAQEGAPTEGRPDKLDQRKIKLLLVKRWITRDVDWSNIVFDLHQHVSLGSAQRFRYFRIDSQRDLAVINFAVHSF